MPECEVQENTECAAGPLRQDRQGSDAMKVRGNEQYKQRNFEEALTRYKEALDLDNSNLVILLNIAAVLFECQRYEEAIASCNEAVERGRKLNQPTEFFCKAYNRIGHSYEKLDNLREAIKAYNASLVENRERTTLIKRQELEKELKRRETLAYQSTELSEAARNEGNRLYKLGSYDDAIKQYSEAILRNPTDLRSYHNRANCYIKLAVPQLALSDAETAIAIDSTNSKSYIRKASALIMMKDFSGAVEACRLASETDVASGSANAREIGEVTRRAYSSLASTTSTKEGREAAAQAAMQRPDIQAILADPVMRTILQQIQTNPSALQEHMKNKNIRENIQKLATSGILQFDG